MIAIQKYLLDHTFGQLAKEHEVSCSFARNGIKFSLNYSVLAKETDEIANQCRGLILIPANGQTLIKSKGFMAKKTFDNICPGETKIINFGFYRFFNYGQPGAAEINWNDPLLRIQEKLDGTLCMVYFDPLLGEWHVATRNTPEADIYLGHNLFTFRSLFEKAVEESLCLSFSDFVNHLDKNNTYCFELCSPYNQVVIRHPQTKISLLAIRDLLSLREISLCDQNIINWASSLNLSLSPAHNLSNIEDVIKFVLSRKGSENEGVVIMDSQFNRVKVKHPDYSLINKVNDSLSESARNCLELILTGKDTDVAPFLPDDLITKIVKMKENLAHFVDVQDKEFISLKAESDCKKSFAFIVGGRKDLWSPPLFAMYDGRAFGTLDFILKHAKDGIFGASTLDTILSFITK